MTKDEALKMALETLERSVSTCFTPFAYEEVMCRRHHFVNETITALKEALAQQVQESVNINCPSCLHSFAVLPVTQRTWTGLTDEEHIALHDKFVDTDCYGLLIDATEAYLKEKNT